jgi:hypothetical protein
MQEKLLGKRGNVNVFRQEIYSTDGDFRYSALWRAREGFSSLGSL